MSPFTSGSPSIAHRWLRGSATVLWIGDSIGKALEGQFFQVLRVTPAGIAIRGADYSGLGSDTWFNSAAGGQGVAALLAERNYSPFPTREVVFNGTTVPTLGLPGAIDSRFASGGTPYASGTRTAITLGSVDWLAASPALQARVILYRNANGSAAVGRNYVRGSADVTTPRGSGAWLTLAATPPRYQADDFTVAPPAAGETLFFESQSFGGAAPGAGSNFVICAALLRTGLPGLTFVPASNGGWDVLNWLDATLIADAAIQSVLPLLAPTDVVISLGQNNPASQTAAQFQASLLQLVARLRVAAPAASIVFCPTYDTNNPATGSGPHLAGFADAHYAAHLATPDSAFLNLYAAAGSFTQLSAAGYLADGVHPTDAGKVYVLQTFQGLLDTLLAGDRDTAAGRYATWADLDDTFGPDNVADWARASLSDATPDVPRIQRALEAADATIDDVFRDGPYAVPLTAPDGPSRATVARWAATIAGVSLYRSRPTTTSGSGSGAPSLEITASGPVSLSATTSTTKSATADPFAQRLADVYTEMSHHKSGTRRLDTDPATATLAYAPAIVL